ncbi:uncharacterized protein TrAFT101_002976 [Trichoderma asperellum]|uniref:Uncharacterized protein n=1 Tax=Trichoderma asperellum (strain ATCC 204424 / CBS 433.97 / NBRC 101777) TaxID=1042311 RepID=A0A2T3ZHZ4_TRIA4|nr:hypothetical protein M441DRAFT_55468 [Trichoderma asperellum CBS 433.97]PTB44421.1 hypothetical protein M441DRAFT_55468 [Trichoderma asperellum CBS 433.97]UKZ87168.1 hypothetical protein TrAFT101_002976 [Trichoderma asperellum]
MSNRSNNNHREYYIPIPLLRRFICWTSLQLQAILAAHLDRLDAQHDQRRGGERDERDERGQGDREEPDMEDIVMGGTSPDMEDVVMGGTSPDMEDIVMGGTSPD